MSREKNKLKNERKTNQNEDIKKWKERNENLKIIGKK